MHPPTPPMESADSSNLARKRVCKACDRCRLKKSKCDGASPCSRCKIDNAICVFGERKKSHDKVYPKGYVEMLEQQQNQLVVGLQELYKRSQNGQGWTGRPLRDSGCGYPLTHDILEALGALKEESNGRKLSFEEDLDSMQRRLFESGATAMRRQSSETSDGSPPALHSHFPDIAMLNSPFSMHQSLPTPPSPSEDASPLTQNRTMFGRDSGFSRPEALQTTFTTSQLQSQSISAPATAFSEFGYYDHFSSASIDPASVAFSHPGLDMTSAGPCLMPDFVEDEDFSLFIKGAP